eukprot:6179444-Pleurochrysis_carterae.AAC.1
MSSEHGGRDEQGTAGDEQGVGRRLGRRQRAVRSVIEEPCAQRNEQGAGRDEHGAAFDAKGATRHTGHGTMHTARRGKQQDAA